MRKLEKFPVKTDFSRHEQLVRNAKGWQTQQRGQVWDKKSRKKHEVSTEYDKARIFLGSVWDKSSRKKHEESAEYVRALQDI